MSCIAYTGGDNRHDHICFIILNVLPIPKWEKDPSLSIHVSNIYMCKLYVYIILYYKLYYILYLYILYIYTNCIHTFIYVFLYTSYTRVLFQTNSSTARPKKRPWTVAACPGRFKGAPCGTGAGLAGVGQPLQAGTTNRWP